MTNARTAVLTVAEPSPDMDHTELNRLLADEAQRLISYLDLFPDDHVAAAWMIEVLMAHYNFAGALVRAVAIPDQLDGLVET